VNLIKEAQKDLSPLTVSEMMTAMGYKAQQVAMDVLKGKVRALEFKRLEQVEDKVVEVEFMYNPTSEAWSLRAGPEHRVNKIELSNGYGADDMLARAKRKQLVKKSNLPYLGF